MFGLNESAFLAMGTIVALGGLALAAWLVLEDR